jgi:hypothetical protein
VNGGDQPESPTSDNNLTANSKAQTKSGGPTPSHRIRVLPRSSEGAVILAPVEERFDEADSLLQIVAMKIEQYRGEGGETRPIGTLGVDSPSAREKDLVKVSARLDRPAYCYVIAFGPDGDDQLYYPADRDVPPLKSAEIEYPANQGYFPLTDGTGLQAFVLVASKEPLPPYARWRSGLGEVPWKPTQADGVWRSDRRGLERTMATRSGTAAPSEPPFTLSQLQSFLQRRPGVAAVWAWAFPVKPDQAEDTPPKTDRGGRSPDK